MSDVNRTDPGAPEPQSRPIRWWLFGILALALALRLPRLDESLWFDELFLSKLMIGEPFLLLKSLYGDIHPPAYFLFMHVWDGWFGDSELSLRTPSLVFGLATVFLTWRLGELFAGRAAGLGAAFLMAVSPVHMWYSQEARPYSAQLFLILLSTLAFGRLWQGRRRWWWVYLLAMLPLALTHYYMAVFPLAFSLMAWLWRAPFRRRIHWVNASILALVAAWVAVKLGTADFKTTMSYLRDFDPRQAWLLFFDWFLFGNCLEPVGPTVAEGLRHGVRVAFQAFGVLLFAFGLVRLRRLRGEGESPPPILPVLFLLPLPLFLLALPWVGFPGTYIERSALPSLPFFYLVLAAGWASLRPPALAAVAGVVGTLFLAVTQVCYFAFPDDWTVYKPNPDWRAAARFLGGEIDAGGSGRRLYTHYVSPEALTYYEPRIQEAAKLETNVARFDRLVSATERIFGKDGFPGAMVHGLVVDFVERFDAWKAEQRARMRLTVYQIGQVDPRQNEAAGAVFYVLCHGPPPCQNETARTVLGDPTVEVLATHEWRWLGLSTVRRRE